MPEGCFVPGCKNTKRYRDSGISFHKFPSDDHMKNKWIQEINSSATVGPRDVVCSDHFLPQDILHLSKKAVLRNYAVPNLRLSQQSVPVPQANSCKHGDSEIKILKKQIVSLREKLSKSQEKIKTLQQKIRRSEIRNKKLNDMLKTLTEDNCIKEELEEILGP